MHPSLFRLIASTINPCYGILHHVPTRSTTARARRPSYRLFGYAYRDFDHDKSSGHRLDPCEALHACAVISKNWAGRSRTHLFREVKIRGDADGLFTMPPNSLIPCRWNSNIIGYSPPQISLTPFHTTPIIYLGITGGVLIPGARVRLVGCIIALSVALQTAVLESYSLPIHQILDVALAHPSRKRLHILCYDFKSAKFGLPIVPCQGVCSQDLELGVFPRLALGLHHLITRRTRFT